MSNITTKELTKTLDVFLTTKTNANIIAKIDSNFESIIIRNWKGFSDRKPICWTIQVTNQDTYY